MGHRAFGHHQQSSLLLGKVREAFQCLSFRLLKKCSLGFSRTLHDQLGERVKQEVRSRLSFGAELNSRDRRVTPPHPQTGRSVAACSLTVSSEWATHIKPQATWTILTFKRRRETPLSLNATEAYVRCRIWTTEILDLAAVMK